jgi:hypothetical protein
MSGALDSRICILLFCLLLIGAGVGCDFKEKPTDGRSAEVKSVLSDVRGLESKEVVRLAGEALKRHPVPRRKYVTVIDYSLPILKDRLYVVDMQSKEIVMQSPVSHAMNSGLLYAREFSNGVGTEKSCVGAFQTQESYSGRFGYAMRVQGLQKGVNDNARRRAIVFHTYSFWPVYSEGCFVTPEDVNRKLIDMVKGGSLVYVIAP